MKFSRYILVLFCIGAFLSCNKTESPVDEEPKATFDRAALLQDWVELAVQPSFDRYVELLNKMSQASTAFADDPSNAHLLSLQSSWKEAYQAWQYVSMYDIGMAETIKLRNFTNIYPTDASLIEDHITSGDYNLELPSTYDAQGFPALDYILFASAADSDAIIARMSDANFKSYLMDLVARVTTLGTAVQQDWQSAYAQQFIANDGASGTASVDKLVNDFLFYYEKFLRAGKVGIPAGVFSGSPRSMAVEAPHSDQYSKQLLIDGLQAVRNFFSGRAVDGRQASKSLESYLDHRSANTTDAVDIAGAILSHWDRAESLLDQVDNSLRQQVESDNAKMLEIYDELQKAVVLLKVDMMQALNIQVDYVDADGD